MRIETPTAQPAALRAADDPHAVVELAFALRGESIALDHGYLFLAALAPQLPGLHGGGLPWQVLPVRGRQVAPGRLELGRGARLGIRLPVADIAQALALAGKSLRIGEDLVVLGTPQIHALHAAPTLVSRFVTIKGFTEAEPFREAFLRQLVDLAGGDHGTLEVGERRVMRVAEHTIVGFRVWLRELADEASLRVQAYGLGGRRRMGAGSFLREGRRP